MVFPNGKITPAHEKLPAPTHWGKLGWTFSPASHGEPLKAAQQRFNELCDNRAGMATIGPNPHLRRVLMSGESQDSGPLKTEAWYSSSVITDK